MEGFIYFKVGFDEFLYVSSCFNNDVEVDVKDYGYGFMEGFICFRLCFDEFMFISSYRFSLGDL